MSNLPHPSELDALAARELDGRVIPHGEKNIALGAFGDIGNFS